MTELLAFCGVGFLAFCLLSATVWAAPEPPPGRYEVCAPGLTVKLSAEGHIVGVVAGAKGLERGLMGRTLLEGCRIHGDAAAKAIGGGGMEFTRTLVAGESADRCQVVERFTPTRNSIRWEVEIRGEGKPWTATIATMLRWPEPESASLWLPWQDPVNTGLNGEGCNDPWNDPLVPRPFVTRTWTYGAARPEADRQNLSFVRGCVVTLPLVSILEKQSDLGLSLVLSPEDSLLDMDLAVNADGSVAVNRFKHRLAQGTSVRFSMDLVAHEADWRGGLRWIAARYPTYFEPPNPHADEMAGCGAYSGDEKPVDAARLKRMAFRIIWKVSDDYACMGMFLPPLKNPDDRWDRLPDAESGGDYKPQWTSFRRLNDFAAWMRGQDFHLLSYFNATEFGMDMHDVPVPAGKLAYSPNLWMRPSEYLKLHMPQAPVIPRMGAWQGGWVVDPGDPAYQAFLLEQAERHIRMIPDSSGICIDRADYLRLCNAGADDGQSWVAGKPVRSLVVSWRSLMDKLGPFMHGKDMVIFCNLMHPRLDLARHLDGIYAEFGAAPSVLNGISLLCLRKPAIAWTRNENQLSDDFFQRHLHLGVFPTAPYPSNNHCITPSPERDKWYVDYGPLLDAMRGKKWVLAPRCVEAATPGVKVNLFEVPGGWALPVTFGGKAQVADVQVCNLAGLGAVKCSVLHPEEESPTPVAATFKDGTLALHVPLRRGCGMVLLRR